MNVLDRLLPRRAIHVVALNDWIRPGWCSYDDMEHPVAWCRKQFGNPDGHKKRFGKPWRVQEFARAVFVFVKKEDADQFSAVFSHLGPTRAVVELTRFQTMFDKTGFGIDLGRFVHREHFSGQSD